MPQYHLDQILNSANKIAIFSHKDTAMKYFDEEYENATAFSALTSSTLSNNFFVSDAFIGSSTARDEVGSLVVKVLKGTATIDEAYATALRNCRKDQ